MAKCAGAFKDDDAGILCRSDDTLIMFGRKLFDKLKRKKDKVDEVKKSVMASMRSIAHLYMQFKARCLAAVPAVTCTSIPCMLVRRNFECLSGAIDDYTTSTTTNETKAGLKISLYYLIKRLCKIVKGQYLIEEDDENASAIDKFVDVLDLQSDLIFGDATCTLNLNRQLKLRRPQQLPAEDDVKKLKSYILLTEWKPLLKTLTWSGTNIIIQN